MLLLFEVSETKNVKFNWLNIWCIGNKAAQEALWKISGGKKIILIKFNENSD